MSRYMEYPLIVPKSNCYDRYTGRPLLENEKKLYTGSISFTQQSTAQNIPVPSYRVPYEQFILSNENPYVPDLRKTSVLPLSKEMSIYYRQFGKQL